MSENPYAARKSAAGPRPPTWRDRIWLALVVFDTGALVLRGMLCVIALVVFGGHMGVIWPLLQLPLVLTGIVGNVRLLRGTGGMWAVLVSTTGLVLLTATVALRYQPAPDAHDLMRYRYMDEASRRDATDAAAAAFRRDFETRRAAHQRLAWAVISANVAYNLVFVYCARRRRNARV